MTVAGRPAQGQALETEGNPVLPPHLPPSLVARRPLYSVCPGGQEGGGWDGLYVPSGELGQGWGELRGPLNLHVKTWVHQDSKINDAFPSGERPQQRQRSMKQGTALETCSWYVHGLRVFIPSKLICGSPKSQSDGIRR